MTKPDEQTLERVSETEAEDEAQAAFSAEQARIDHWLSLSEAEQEAVIRLELR